MKKEKTKFIKRSVMFSIVFVILLLMYMLIVIAFSRTPNLTAWAHETLSVKDRRSLEIEQPKLVILGGSNVLFGISAEQMENELNIPSVNYGLHAGLGDYLFYRAKKILRPGDIVLMALEYEYYWYEKKILFGKQNTKEEYILTHDRQYYDQLNPLQQMNILLIGLEDLQKNIRYQSKTPKGYNANTLNKWGDETINSFETKKTFSPSRINFPEDFDERFGNFDGVNAIIDFSLWCKKNNITIIATFSPASYLKEYNNIEYQSSFYKMFHLYENLDVPVIGHPNDFFYDHDVFYDTKDHLTDIYMHERTSFLIQGMNDIKNLQTSTKDDPVKSGNFTIEQEKEYFDHSPTNLVLDLVIEDIF